MQKEQQQQQKKVDIRKYLEEVRHLEQVNSREFYRTIFPEGALEKHHDNPEEYEKGKYTGVIVEVTKEKTADGKVKVLRHTVTDDLEKIEEVAKRDNFCLMSPISYAGKSRKSENARWLYAIAVDMDGIETENNLEVLFGQIAKNKFFAEGRVWRGIPTPTYLVFSGTGLHLYYVLDEPIPLYPNVVRELEKLKKRITWQIWTQGASELSDNVQYESLFQGFRMVGTVTKRGTKAVAYKYGAGDKVTLEYLNESVPDAYRADLRKKISILTLEDAKKKYPDWYEKRIVKKAPKGTWICKRALYDWWLRRMPEVEQGHRYWYVLTLAVYAKKCAIPYEELVSDALDSIPYLDSIGTDDPFTKSDVMKAVEAYNDSYMTYPIDTIVARTGLPIQKNKRNGRTQALHLKGARAIQSINDEANGTNWREGNGRERKLDVVQKWRLLNPTGRKVDCIKETGLTKPTVYKWWNEESPQLNLAFFRVMRMKNPKMTPDECAACTGLSREFVYKWWGKLNEVIGVIHGSTPEADNVITIDQQLGILKKVSF